MIRVSLDPQAQLAMTVTYKFRDTKEVA